MRLGFRPGSESGRAAMTVWDGPKIIYTDDIKIGSNHSRRTFMKNVTELRSRIDVEGLEQRLIDISVQLAEMTDKAAEPPKVTRDELVKAADIQTLEMLNGMPSDVVAEAEELLLDPRLIDQILYDAEAIGVVGEQVLAATVYVLGTSRLLDKPLSAITQGVTSSGKSYVQQRTGELFPAEAVLRATDITTNALYYMPLGGLLHKFVVAGERSRMESDDRAEATRALREMISGGELRKVVPVKSPEGGMVSREVWQPGPIAFIESTTVANIFDEDANRCLLLGTDESPRQTERVVFAQAIGATRSKPVLPGIAARHHALQRMLKRCRVVIPFAPALAACMPTRRQDARRAMPQVLSMVSAVALLHQRQRVVGDIEHGTVIQATMLDYVIARRLLTGPMGSGLGGGLPDAVIRFGRRVYEKYGTEVFDSNEPARTDDHVHAKGKVNEYLRKLADAGHAECTEPGRGSLPAKWRMLDDVPDAGEVWLPTLDQLRGEGT
jgi:hypothetical protein